MLSVLRRLAGRAPAAPQGFPADAPIETLYRFSLRGIELELPRAILTEELWWAFVRGYYESSEIAALTATIRAGDAVLEVGGGVGFISSLVLKQLGAGPVTVVEANPALIPIIHRSHALNGVRAEVIQGIVAADDGECGFYLQPAFHCSSTLALPDSEEVRLRAVGLAGLLVAVRPDVVVVDIEGGEATLFDGVDLRRVRSVVVEVHEPYIGLAGIARCFGALALAGFAYDPASGGTNVVFSRVDSRM